MLEQPTTLTKKNKLDDKIVKLFTRGTSVCIIILGRRETGKTDFSLLIAETLNKYGVMSHCASNIKIYESHFPIKHITNLQDLEYWSANNQGKKLFVFDETGKSLRRRTPMAKLNISLIDKLQILRKYKLNLILIAPDEKYVDSAGLGSDVLDAIIVKPQFKNPKVALWHDTLEQNEFWLTGIPRTSIKFDTWDIAPFTLTASSIKPVFKERDLNILWEYSHGKTVRELGVHPQEMSRIVKRFVKEVMERDSHTSHHIAIEDTIPVNNVTNKPEPMEKHLNSVG